MPKPEKHQKPQSNKTKNVKAVSHGDPDANIPDDVRVVYAEESNRNDG